MQIPVIIPFFISFYIYYCLKLIFLNPRIAQTYNTFYANIHMTTTLLTLLCFFHLPPDFHTSPTLPCQNTQVPAPNITIGESGIHTFVLLYHNYRRHCSFLFQLSVAAFEKYQKLIVLFQMRRNIWGGKVLCSFSSCSFSLTSKFFN
jgi:hypothetical protein